MMKRLVPVLWLGLLAVARLGYGIDTVPGGNPHPVTSGAGNPFNDYVAGVVAYVLLIGFLVAVLLIGGLLIVNLGLLSKREEDKAFVPRREPSDVGILKHDFFPAVPQDKRILPAEEGDTEEPGSGKSAA